MSQLRVRLTHADAVQDIDEVVFLESVVFVADLADASLGVVAYSRLRAQNVDAFVGHLEGTVGGVREHGADEEVELVVEAEHGAEVEVEVHCHRRAHQAVVALGPVGHADAPGVVELELRPVDDVSVAVAEHGVAVAQVDDLLALLVEVVLHRVVLEAEVDADKRVVEELLPGLRAVGLSPEADIGAIHGVVGVDGQGQMMGITQARLHIKALCRQRRRCQDHKRYEPPFPHGKRITCRLSSSRSCDVPSW